MADILYYVSHDPHPGIRPSGDPDGRFKRRAYKKAQVWANDCSRDAISIRVRWINTRVYKFEIN